MNSLRQEEGSSSSDSDQPRDMPHYPSLGESRTLQPSNSGGNRVYPSPLSDEAIVVRLENVHKTYLIGIEGVAALRGVSLSVRRGEFLCILGTSGGGKTTLMNIMGTIDRPTKGHLTLCNERIRASTKDKVLANLRLRRLAFVFQTFNLIGSMTAQENVELPMLLAGTLSRKAIKERALDLMKRMDIGNLVDRLPSEVSGGQQPTQCCHFGCETYP